MQKGEVKFIPELDIFNVLPFFQLVFIRLYRINVIVFYTQSQQRQLRSQSTLFPAEQIVEANPMHA